MTVLCTSSTADRLPYPLFVQPALVLVEGSDDQEFIARVIEHLALENFQVHSVNGKAHWHKKIHALSVDDSFVEHVRAVGFVRDADANPISTWQSCIDGIQAAGLSPPEAPLIVSDGPVPTAVLILPDDQQEGELEDLILRSLDDKRLRCASGYASCLKTAKLPHSESSKARVRAYLSLLPSEPRDLRVALARGDIDVGHPALQTVHAFVQAIASALT